MHLSLANDDNGPMPLYIEVVTAEAVALASERPNDSDIVPAHRVTLTYDDINELLQAVCERRRAKFFAGREHDTAGVKARKEAEERADQDDHRWRNGLAGLKPPTDSPFDQKLAKAREEYRAEQAGDSLVKQLASDWDAEGMDAVDHYEDAHGSQDEDDSKPDFSRFVTHPNVSDHSPVIKGTLVTVSHVVSLIVDGWTWSDILRAHPELTEDDIRACLAYTVAADEARCAEGMDAERIEAGL